MNQGRRILVVAQAPTIAGTLVSLGLSRDDSDDLVVFTTFARARTQLMAGMDLLITEVKLGAHNGLHLAVRALAAGIPSIVIGPSDPVFEHEATRLGAAYVSTSRLRHGTLESLITRLIPRRRHEAPLFVPWRDRPIAAGTVGSSSTVQ
jgi:hypothetical protein